MLLAHKVELRPSAAQREYFDRACGTRRHAYNQLLAHFRQPGVKWSKAAAYAHFIRVIRPQFPWYADVSARASRNAIDDLDNAYKHFFRRVKLGQKPGFPIFKKKDVNDSFALRETVKFDVEGRMLRLEKCPGKVKMRQRLRFAGETKQVTVSKCAGRYHAAVLVETADYDTRAGLKLPAIGVDFGVRALATLSDGTVISANQKLKANLRRLKRRSRNLSKKQRGAKRRAKAKLSRARLHERIANQRKAALHEASDLITRKADVVVIEDLNVKGMLSRRKKTSAPASGGRKTRAVGRSDVEAIQRTSVDSVNKPARDRPAFRRGMLKSRSMARAISDAGFGTLRAMVEYKAKLRGVTITIADRFYPSSKTCSECGCVKKDLKRGDETFWCDECNFEMDRDLNAALNLRRLHTFAAVEKRTQEPRQTTDLSVAAVLTA